MASKRSTVTHHFGGGWATDFGQSVPGLMPDQGGNIILPFLVNAEDVWYEADGGPHKMPGTTRLNATAITGSPRIRGLFDYWMQGVAGTPTHRRVAFAGTQVWQDGGSGSFSSIGSGLGDGAVP